jgi:hypothetical protein
MYTTLQVVNDCLATMGEAPLNSLSESHGFKGSALRCLQQVDRQTQSRGWWYNTEEMTLTPSPDDKSIYLPGDVARVNFGFISVTGHNCGQWQGRYVQRGRRLYDVTKGTYEIEETLTAQLVRLVPFPDLPLCVAELVAAETVLKFQSDYDGDNNRRAELVSAVKDARTWANSEDIRQRRVNLYNINTRLQRIKRVTSRARFSY